MLKHMMDDLTALDIKLSAVTVGKDNIVYCMIFRMSPLPLPHLLRQHQRQHSQRARRSALYHRRCGSELEYTVRCTGEGHVRHIPQHSSDRHVPAPRRTLCPSLQSAVLPSGETVQLEAYAVAPATSEAPAASSVNPHFFSPGTGLSRPRFWKI